MPAYTFLIWQKKRLPLQRADSTFRFLFFNSLTNTPLALLAARWHSRLAQAPQELLLEFSP